MTRDNVLNPSMLKVLIFYILSLAGFSAMLIVFGTFEKFPSFWMIWTAGFFTTGFSGWMNNRIKESGGIIAPFSIYIFLLFGFSVLVLHYLFSMDMFLVEQHRRLSASVLSSLIGSAFAILIGYFALRKETNS